MGAACKRPMTSSKLDLPDPLGPIRTVHAGRSKFMPAGPKDRRLVARILCSMGSGMVRGSVHFRAITLRSILMESDAEPGPEHAAG